MQKHEGKHFPPPGQSGCESNYDAGNGTEVAGLEKARPIDNTHVLEEEPREYPAAARSSHLPLDPVQNIIRRFGSNLKA